MWECLNLLWSYYIHLCFSTSPGVKNPQNPISFFIYSTVAEAAFSIVSSSYKIDQHLISTMVSYHFGHYIKLNIKNCLNCLYLQRIIALNFWKHVQTKQFFTWSSMCFCISNYIRYQNFFHQNICFHYRWVKRPKRTKLCCNLTYEDSFSEFQFLMRLLWTKIKHVFLVCYNFSKPLADVILSSLRSIFCAVFPGLCCHTFARLVS